MGSAQKDNAVRNVLKNLCSNHGWSYGVFWRFDPRNPLLLTLQDAYYDEKFGGLIDDLRIQVHMLGGGIIGQAAYTKNHRWMLSDDQHGVQNPLGSSHDMFQLLDDSEFHHQFYSGIKTIAVIPVEPQGVVQFGSTKKIPEGTDFVNRTKKLFKANENLEGHLPSASAPSLSNQDCSPNGLFASLISPEGSCFPDLRSMQGASAGNPSGTNSSTYPTQSFSFTPDSKLMPPSFENSSHFDKQFQPSCSNSLDMLVNQSTTQLEQPFLQFSDPVNFSATSSWSEDCSFTPFKQPNSLPCGNSVATFEDSTFASQYNSDISRMQGFEVNELFQNSDYIATDIHKPYSLDNFSQWFISSPEHSHVTLASTQNDNLFTQTVGLAPINPPVNHLANDMLGSSGNDYGCGHTNWASMLMSAENYGHLGSDSYNLESIPSQRKGLFSELGIEKLLGGSSTSNTISTSCLEDQVSSVTKRSSDGSSLWDTGYFQPLRHGLFPKKEIVTKSDPGLWMGTDGYSINTGSTVSQASRLVEQPVKPTKKKAKPGTRPRPKDRQQILDRMAELRQLIPNGEKMSIDCLLDRTIKHMLFLESVTKHADRLKHVDEMKDTPVPRDYSSNCGGNNVTWACEFGNQTMTCPLIVEDLSTPGQMLIEMLCEEQGFFLEIVDIIRGFGLTILKGVMEVREDKIWARFIVEAEANKHVTRHEIFSALVQLLRTSAPSDELGKAIDGGTSVHNNYQQYPVGLAETLHCINL